MKIQRYTEQFRDEADSDDGGIVVGIKVPGLITHGDIRKAIEGHPLSASIYPGHEAPWFRIVDINGKPRMCRSGK